ncbi:hypothetical protein C1H57_00025 [Clostridium sp. 2-1]|uniref:VWA domain-containing protein n=1 Tax=Clostridium TaxID=1485 RepID=UPI000CDB5F44|nr:MULTISPECIES: VWA domain-containing protein [Clostridium]MBN7574176.1 VWA domain-containing protein [Clostridium beijerinckii]MBN7579231.1 VWA domain-containing protein [Clostridium beijerinckii]MBN7583926.1 VWA domain-containing protein [Clostridium beijerinckii]MBO0519503.1 VWA domain-containing protein [Clostridium beijerinckii]POO93191.1 hypothetical protein C1H57_00025 [Clostridium sp. 2-1]
MKFKIANKRMVSLTILITFMISIIGVGSYVNAVDDLVNINRTVSVSNVKAGDTFDVKYTITPKPIAASSQDNNKQKEIVFVMDTSGSMDWIVGADRKPYYYGEKSRLRIMKNVAENFITKFNNNDKARISLMQYNYYATNITNNFTNIKSNNINDFTGNNGYIERLNANGSTNIGDGLRKAYYMLSDNAQGQDKYIVLMTDGEAEAYSYNNSGYYMSDGTNYNYYYTSWNNSHTYANPDCREDSMKYAKKVASEKIATNSNINTFVIGFGSGANGDKNKQIADAAKGTYFQAQNESTITEIYDRIQKIIDTDVSGKVHFEENISSNLEVVNVKNQNLTQEYAFNNNKLSIDFNNYYTLNNGSYYSDPIEFTVTYKVKDGNICKLGAGGNSSFVKIDVLSKTETEYFPEKIINNSIPTQVTMEVSDSTGVIDKYDTLAQNPPSNRYDKVNNQYKLLGDSYVNILAQGNEINFMQYQFVKSDTNPTDLPNNNWKDIDITNTEINEDVDVEKSGNLTQRSYNVSHLPPVNSGLTVEQANSKYWSNKELVFKYPFEATTYKSTQYATSRDSFGALENYVKADGTNAKRWVTKNAFLKNDMTIGNDYQEAAKFWGYLKVENDGYYKFGASSDDGCKADITIDKTTHTFVNMFQLQGSTFGSDNNVYNLKKDKYYPIYIEYFNWGGNADFRLLYSYASTNNSITINKDSSVIPSSWFYPSKSTAPGEYATNTFTGRAGIKIPDDIGKYYIAYRAGKRDANNNITEIQKSGFYGPFVRNERFTLSRSLTNDNPQVGDIVEINYTISPNAIPITDIYKNYKSGDSIPNQLKISDLKIQQVLPSGLTYVGSSDNASIVNNSNEISGVITPNIDPNFKQNIVYNLEGSTYKADNVTVTIKVRPTIQGEFNLLKENSILTYTDISIDSTKQGAQRQCNFPDFQFTVNSNSAISQHGIYHRSDNTIDSSNLNVIDKVPTELAMIVDVKSSNLVIDWNIDKTNISDSQIIFKKYKIINGSIDMNHPEQLNLDISTNNSGTISNTTGFNMESGSKYIIIYTITPEKKSGNNINIGASIEGTSNSKPLNLTIKGLPDLF